VRAGELSCKGIQYSSQRRTLHEAAAKTGITSICKLLLVAQKPRRALNVPRLMREVYDGKFFKDGIAVRTTIEQTRKAA
jgi:DNA-binding response OmpR family regulator